MSNVDKGPDRESEDRSLMIALGCFGAIGMMLFATGLVILLGEEPMSLEKASPLANVAPAPPVRPVPPMFEEEAPRDPSAPIHHAPGPREDLPRQTPTRMDMVAAMNGVSDTVRMCADGQHGVAAVRVVFGSDGEVASAAVSGGSHLPVVRSCIARAVRAARVPPFAQATFTVNYPFRL